MTAVSGRQGGIIGAECNAAAGAAEGPSRRGGGSATCADRARSCVRFGLACGVRRANRTADAAFLSVCGATAKMLLCDRLIGALLPPRRHGGRRAGERGHLVDQVGAPAGLQRGRCAWLTRMHVHKPLCLQQPPPALLFCAMQVQYDEDGFRTVLPEGQIDEVMSRQRKPFACPWASAGP